MTRLAVGVVFLSLIVSKRAEAIINFDVADAAHNTTPPTGAFADSGWQYQGYFGGVLGTMISPHHFITAKHVGVNATFEYDSLFSGVATESFSVNVAANGGVGYWEFPDSDLRLFEVTGDFPIWAPLYSGDDEVGKEIIFFGRGGGRGDEVNLAPGGLKGWLSGPRDGTTRWGRNVVTDAVSNLTDFGEVLAAEFNAMSGIEESHFTGGDSGGGTFIRDSDGVWKLAGINAAIDGPFDTNNVVGDSTSFNAALFDTRGFYVGSDAEGWTLTAASIDAVPSSLYVSRISAYHDQILDVIPEPGYLPKYWVVFISLLAATRRRKFAR